MFSRRLSPLTMLVLTCALAVATGSIAGLPGSELNIDEWGGKPPPRTPLIAAGPDDPTVSTSARFWFAAKGSKDGYECKLDAREFQSCTSPQSYEDLSIGVHTFQVVTVSGGQRSTPAHYLWNIERPPTEPPATPTIDSAPPSITDARDATVAFSSATPGVGYFCRLDSDEFAPCVSPKRYVRLGLGQHKFYVKARNTAGMDSGIASVTWVIGDLPAPPPPPPPPAEPPATPTIDSGPPSVTEAKDATFTSSSVTAGVTFLCRLDADVFAACVSPKTYGNLALGEHRFAVKAKNAANVESGMASVTWTIQAPPPPPTEPPPSPTPPTAPPATPTIDSGPPSVTTATTATFAFSSKSPGVSFHCRLDANAFAPCTSPKSYSSLSLGEHRFGVKAVDAAGTESGIASVGWKVEAAPPPPPSTPPPPPEPPVTPTITSGPPSVTNATNATFAFSSSTAGVVYLCRIDAATFASCASPKGYSGLAAGQHRFDVKARNAAGTESGVASATWTVDTASPTAAITSPPAGAQLSNTVDVAVSATDNVRIERVELRVDGTPAGVSTVSPHVFRWDTTTVSNGQHTVEARSFDVAGNQSAPATRTYTVSNSSSPGSCSGVQVAPGSSLQAAVDSNPEGTTFCLRAGVHRFTQSVVPRPRSVFLGEPGAVLSGARDITGLFTPSGSVWVASGMTYEGAGNPGWPNPCEGGGTLCLRTNDVYYDDRFLTRVGSLGEVSSGKYFFDYGSDRIYIGESPTGHKVEVSVAPHALRSHGTGAVNVTVRGLVIEKFATPASDGAIQGNDGWILENLTVRLNHAVGVSGFDVFRNGLVHDNGQAGLSTFDDTGQIVEGNEIYSNHRIPIICWHGGALKVLRTRNATIRNNYAHDDSCIGLWTDWDNIGTLFEGNRVERTAGPGIFHEASFDAVIRNNIVRDTGFGPESRGWIDGSGILVNSSRNVEIYGNTVEGNRHGIGGTSTDRGSSSAYGARELKNLRVHHNIIKETWRSPEGWWSTAGGVAGGLQQPFASQAHFDHNTYTICAATEFSGPKPAGSTNYGGMRWSEWRAQGQDANSTVSMNC